MTPTVGKLQDVPKKHVIYTFKNFPSVNKSRCNWERSLQLPYGYMKNG
jgi:hypothetical protein